MKILNLTQHPATPDQKADGVVDLVDGEELQILKELLTFEDLPSIEDIFMRAEKIAELAKNHSAEYAMIGGAPYLMGALEDSLYSVGTTPMYSFSVRQSVEETMPDGTVRKSNIFKHIGFIDV